MKIAVDSAKCRGHARCNALAPAAFDLDDEGYAMVTDEAVNLPARDLENAAESCPEQAITVQP
ncbi:ferredoxin [Mycobacterium saskatchewanense]|uniref:Ferredoxin n=1 Tax=Mycobacterium saskatchewanense TaxID=220927 RepID=A0AAJ3NLK1_9MYCO|nr:ferredoxin [Mycobacterium saskatchewanense]ORW68094.1 hypothetical protein AWC23_21945 [Mycobacterium saskatchewanense]BBX66458.1 ferredoxin [Mycobacterium saskatchewanense]